MSAARDPARQAPPRIVVLGSINMDLVMRVPHAPAAGETLLGHSIATIAGGKGANQAVSCARQGARVAMIGCVGDDANGAALREALAREGVDTTQVRTAADASTGVALILVEDSGQNRIVMVPGANAGLEVDPDALGVQLQGAAFLVLQFETPLAQVARAIAAARAAGCKVMLNPSPVHALPEDWWPGIDTLVVNEIEAQALCGLRADAPQEAAQAGRALRQRGVRRVVVTMGALGAVAIDDAGARHHPAPAVRPVDTTAAGDTLLGALATALAEGADLDQAVSLGIRAAALCVQRAGAQPSIPLRGDVLRSPPAPSWSPL